MLLFIEFWQGDIYMCIFFFNIVVQQPGGHFFLNDWSPSSADLPVFWLLTLCNLMHSFLVTLVGSFGLIMQVHLQLRNFSFLFIFLLSLHLLLHFFLILLMNKYCIFPNHISCLLCSLSYFLTSLFNFKLCKNRKRF